MGAGLFQNIHLCVGKLKIRAGKVKIRVEKMSQSLASIKIANAQLRKNRKYKI
jgi:hypothetical protein